VYVPSVAFASNIRADNEKRKRRRAQQLAAGGKGGKDWRRRAADAGAGGAADAGGDGLEGAVDWSRRMRNAAKSVSGCVDIPEEFTVVMMRALVALQVL
jgi:hypothetical protein